MDELAWIFIVFFGNLGLTAALTWWRRIAKDDSPGWHFSVLWAVIIFGLATIARIVDDVAGGHHDWIGQAVKITFWASLSASAFAWAISNLTHLVSVWLARQVRITDDFEAS